MSEIRPIAISTKNAEQVTGFPWRWLREHSADLGVEIITIDGKSCILADDLLAALKRRSTTPVVAEDSHDELAAMRARIAAAG